MPLGGPEKAALEAFVKSRRGQRVLIASSQDKLIAYFDGKAVAVTELTTTPPVVKDELDEWKEEWRDYARSAGIGDKVDRDRVVMWLEKLSAGPGASKATGVAAKALETLDLHGVHLSASAISRRRWRSARQVTKSLNRPRARVWVSCMWGSRTMRTTKRNGNA